MRCLYNINAIALAAQGTLAGHEERIYRCALWIASLPHGIWNLTAVGFEPTQLALVELESTPLDHSGKVSCQSTCPERFTVVYSSKQQIQASNAVYVVLHTFAKHKTLWPSG